METPVHGRPRRYGFPERRGFSLPLAGHLVAALDELSARHFHLIRAFPSDRIAVVPEGCPRSVAMITAHMVAAELFWIGALTGSSPDPELAAALDTSVRDPAAALSVRELERSCRRVREDVTVPALRPLTALDAVVPAAGPVATLTARGVLMHLIWHWTYHNGQCGLLAMQAGIDYRWTFEDALGVPG